MGKMVMENWLKTGALVCAMLVVPAISSAQVGTCSPNAASDHSYARNSSRQAAHLLNGMEYDARRVQYHAQIMQDFAYHTNFAWDTSGIELMRVRREINDMGKRLCELEKMEHRLPLAEQQAIQTVTPVVQQMASNADTAINFHNTHDNGYWASSFRDSARNLHSEASTVIHQIRGSERAAG